MIGRFRTRTTVGVVLVDPVRLDLVDIGVDRDVVVGQVVVHHEPGARVDDPGLVLH